MKTQAQKPIRIYVSSSFLANDRAAKFCSLLAKEGVPFTAASLPPSDWDDMATNSLQLRKQLRSLIEPSDYVFIIADRYTAHKAAVDMEIETAHVFGVPVVVIQPWSCWSIPTPLLNQTYLVFNWGQKQLFETLDKHVGYYEQRAKNE